MDCDFAPIARWDVLDKTLDDYIPSCGAEDQIRINRITKIAIKCILSFAICCLVTAILFPWPVALIIGSVAAGISLYYLLKTPSAQYASFTEGLTDWATRWGLRKKS
jgi:hypothetical protein